MSASRRISGRYLYIYMLLFLCSIILVACNWQFGERSLINSEWKLTAIERSSPTSITLIQEPSKYTLRLKPDGEFEVKANCNMVFGTYVLEEETVAFQYIPREKLLVDCKDENLYVQYIILLRLVVSYKLEDGHLYLNLEDGRGKMIFE